MHFTTILNQAKEIYMLIKYDKEIQLIKEIIIREGKRIREINIAHVDVRKKDGYDLVTEEDIHIEKLIIEAIHREFPEDSIISEEHYSDNTLTDNRTWVIDPIDGTFNFANNIPMYGIQVALFDKKEAILSLIYLPMLDEFYLSAKDSGAYLNGERITVDNVTNMSKAVLSMGDFSHTQLVRRDIQIDVFNRVVRTMRKIKIWSAACYDFCMLSSGRTHAHIVLSSSIWDLDPGILLAKEAGAKVRIVHYDPNSDAIGYVVAATDELLDKLLELAELS